MRIWALADPRFLNRKHLLGEHVEAHMLLAALDGRGWTSHPETLRFEGRPELVALRHELLREEMDRRWPGRHDDGRHKTPVQLTDEMGQIFACYRGHDDLADAFTFVLEGVEWPAPAFGADSPWERDQMTQAQYRALGDDWSAERHKVKQDG